MKWNVRPKGLRDMEDAGRGKAGRISATWKAIVAHRTLYLFILPVFVLALIFNYGPMVGVLMVFQDFDPMKGFFGSPFVGLDNLARLFKTPVFYKALRNTVVISSLRLCIEFPMPILFALLLNELRRARFKKIVQTISYLPHFISWVIVAGIWYKLLSIDNGVINEFLMFLGFVDEPVYFMQEQALFYPVILFTSLWKGVGYGSIYYLAAIAGADPELYEAANIDGAGRFRQALHITMPAMQGTIVLLLIFQISGLLNAGFHQLYTMGNIATRELGDILDTAVLRILLTGRIRDMPLGAAMDFFKAVIGIILFVGANFLSRALKQESII